MEYPLMLDDPGKEMIFLRKESCLFTKKPQQKSMSKDIGFCGVFFAMLLKYFQLIHFMQDLYTQLMRM